MECLGEGAGLGTDEKGCGAEAETPEPPKFAITQADVPNAETHTEKNNERDPERHHVADSELWALLEREREEEEAQVDREQPQTHRELAVTPTPIKWPCGGLLQTFYGTFSPPAIRGPALFCVWTLDPQDSRPLRLDLQQLVLGPGDRLTVYNREQGKGDIIKIVSFL